MHMSIIQHFQAHLQTCGAPCTPQAYKVVYEGIDHKSSDIFRLANQMRKENVDVVGDKPVKNDTGEMSMSEEAKQNVWAAHYERLLNVEFDWDPDHLSNEPPLEGRLS